MGLEEGYAMIKAIILIACGAALLGCSNLRSYEFKVDDPTRKERSLEEPYTSHPQRRVLYPN